MEKDSLSNALPDTYGIVDWSCLDSCSGIVNSLCINYSSAIIITIYT